MASERLRDLCVSEETPIRNALRQMDSAHRGILLVVRPDGQLFGILTDPDVRRLLISGVDVDDPVGSVCNRDFLSWPAREPREGAARLLKARRLRHMPIVDEDGRLEDLLELDELDFQRFDHPVVLMAGGLGTRLRPLTESCPKPMIPLQGRPILEHILDAFLDQGFHRFYISVHYLGEQIVDHFGDGSRWNAEIRYLEEDRPLGTAGALGLLTERPRHPLIVINGDVLTGADFRSLLRFHEDQEAFATMAVFDYAIQIPFGVVQMEDAEILGIEEKPVRHYRVNAGFYVLDPGVLDLVPRGERLEMPDLFRSLREERRRIRAYMIRESWLDIGKPEHLEEVLNQLDEGA